MQIAALLPIFLIWLLRLGAIMAAVNKKQWMKELGSTIRHKTIFDLAIPGTHHSAFIPEKSFLFSFFHSKIQCQERSIEEQLNSGIRFLDIRITNDSGSNEIVISHYLRSKITLRKVLEEVRKFLQQNPSELVILLIREDWDAPLTAEETQIAQTIVKETIGQKIIPGKYISRSFKNLLKKGQIIVSGLEIEKNLLNTPFQLSWYQTKGRNSEEMLERTAEFLKTTNHKDGRLKILDLIITLESPDVLETIKGLAPGLNSLLVEALTQKTEKLKKIAELGSIFMLDFYEDSTVDCIIALNKDRK